MMAIHAEHLAFQRDLEERGILFVAGPLLNDEGSAPSGESMNIYRVDSLEAAEAIAESDPMFKHGFRSFKLRPWIMNEGSLSLDLKFSTRTIKVS